MDKHLKTLKAISDPKRLEILKELAEKHLCVGALQCRLRITQSAVSQHLRILKEAGLVNAEKQGYWVHYSLNKKQIKTLEKYLTDLMQNLLKGTAKICCLSNKEENKE